MFAFNISARPVVVDRCKWNGLRGVLLDCIMIWWVDGYHDHEPDDDGGKMMLPLPLLPPPFAFHRAFWVASVNH